MPNESIEQITIYQITGPCLELMFGMMRQLAQWADNYPPDAERETILERYGGSAVEYVDTCISRAMETAEPVKVIEGLG